MNSDGKIPDFLLESWQEFTGQVEKRLEAGAREYGDASLKAPPTGLADEVLEELLDVMGWGFLLWLRMKGLQMAIRARTTE